MAATDCVFGAGIVDFPAAFADALRFEAVGKFVFRPAEEANV